MSGLKLKDSIFDTSFNGNNEWDFSGIVKNDVATNSSKSDIVDVSKSTAFKQTDTSGSFVDNMTNLWGNDYTSNPGGGSEKTITDDSMFSSSNIGSTLKGGGAIIGALAGIYGTLEQTKFNKEVLGMEKDRINRNIAREDKLQKNYEGVWS